MNPRLFKKIGIACFAMTAILLFAAYERNQANADNVEAVKRMVENSPSGGGVLGGTDLEPATPSFTKYAIFFAVLLGGAGCYCFVKAAGGRREAVSATGDGESSCGPQAEQKDAQVSGALVLVRVFTGTIEAEVARGLLAGAGVPAFVSADDCGGVRPELQVGVGVRLLVPEEHAAEAVRLLDRPRPSCEEEG